MQVQPPVKYLTNKEILAEIHKSKNSYCYYIEPKYANYDTIVNCVKDITPKLAEQVFQKKNSKQKKGAPIIEPTAIDDLVFRVMTYSHIPLSDDKKKRSRSIAGQGHLRTNFPPFKHYILKDGQPEEVGRSHWIGGFENGHFSIDHGNISPRLAKMFILLSERYARRGNWRGYCVCDETQALTDRGWLNQHEITENDKVLSYQDGQLLWSSIKSIYRDHDYDGKMFKMTVQGMDALVTPGHKFVTDSGIKPVEHLIARDKIILSGDSVKTTNAPVYDDAFVELVGWFVTEGCYYSANDRNYKRVSIYQNEGQYAERIRKCITRLGEKYSEYKKSKNICFNLTKNLCEKLLLVANNKVLSMEFIMALTENQRTLLIDTMIDGDGWRTIQGNTLKIGYTQKDKNHVDAFIALCTMNGLRTSVKSSKGNAFGKPTHYYTVTIFSNNKKYSKVENIDFHGAKRNGTRKGIGKIYHPNQPTVDYKGTVWCLETEYGSFMVRRNGYSYLTGNSYISDMTASSVLQLVQIGLQFDESKSDNPFAFYTTCLKNSFTRVLNVEKKNQNIRDDLLIIAGAKPSFTRQIEHELNSAHPEPSAAPAKKRGRPSTKD